MKVSPESFLIGELPPKSFKNIFLINGSEETYIKRIEKKILENIKINGFENVERFERASLSEINLPKNTSLFSNLRVEIHSSPKDINTKALELINTEEMILIIKDSKIKNSSKIKKFFDFHKNFLSITCYELSKKSKQNFLDLFLKKKNIILEKDAYWFFLDYSDNKYQLFENELNKLEDFGGGEITYNEIRFLISPNDNKDFANIFFSTLTSPQNIIKNTSNEIDTSADVYQLLQKAKLYIDFAIRFKDLEEARAGFPRYLFLEKERFLNLFKKLTNKKIFNVLLLIKKSELLLRKNDSMFLSISQRFLLNVMKSLK